MLSRLVADKGVIEYCKAARKIRKKFPHTIFQLAGSLDLNPSGLNYKQIKPYVDSNDIEYLGQIDDVRNVLENVDIMFCLPIERELQDQF